MRRIAQILILIFVAILIIPVFLPDKIEAIAEKSINMPAGVVFEDFNNLSEYSKWEPWASGDSLSTQEFFSPYKGKGAGYKWESNGKNGILTIIETEKDKKIKYKMEGFGLGKDSEMQVELIQTDSVSTSVKWSIVSKKINYFSRYYSYFTSDNLSKKMDEGLNQLSEFLKTSAMTKEQADSLKPGMISTEQFEGQKFISVLNETTFETDEIVTATEESFGLIYSYLTDFLKIPPANIGYPVCYFDFIDTVAKETKFHAGYPVSEPVKTGEGMEFVLIPASKTLICTHKGDYSTIEQTIGQMKDYARKNRLILKNSFWEEFLNNPKEIKNREELLTKIYIPIKE